MSIIPLLANSSFDPEAVETLSAAFDDAWEKLKQSGSTFARPAYERGARERTRRQGNGPHRRAGDQRS